LEKNLVLTGMMGVGKSTIGKKLAKKLKLKFVDIDKVIESKEKSTISEIFTNKGESYFRKIEKRVTLEELRKKHVVIALGGGAFMSNIIRNEVKDTTISFWLDLNLKKLLPRLKNISKRPLLNQVNLEKTLKKIYSERKKIYNKSNFKVKCNSKNIEEITREIILLYESTRNKS
jgi:shikimate kinase